jgi:glycosyltransferase involved in cell wall biosynthesis
MIKPKISVVMPVHNGEKYLGISVESILSQSFKNYEFIIVDDGSIDNSSKIVENYKQKDKRIIVVHNTKNIGTTKSLNIGLSVAKGKYIVRMDVDDWSYPDRLQKQYDYMEKHSDVGVSGGTIEVCDKNLNKLNVREYPLIDRNIRDIIFRYSPFAHSATIWNKEIMKRVGNYNENLPLSQDCELYFKIGKLAKFGNLKDKLIKLRMHQNSSSASKSLLQEQYAIFARIKAVMEYGYKVSFGDKLFVFGRIIALFIVPSEIKFWLFNLLRRKR